MKERPILFKGEMVRAILDGRKTQTRRVIKPPPTAELLREYARISQKHGVTTTPEQFAASCIVSPYGQPGDILWVREACYIEERETVKAVWYKADSHERDRIKWRPSIHMPRWASRITLEITAVRVERLQKISEMDAFGEGVDTEGDDYNRAEHAQLGGVSVEGGSPAVFAYKGLWEKINGAESWDANPWVWVIEFKRVKP